MVILMPKGVINSNVSVKMININNIFTGCIHTSISFEREAKRGREMKTRKRKMWSAQYIGDFYRQRKFSETSLISIILSRPTSLRYELVHSQN